MGYQWSFRIQNSVEYQWIFRIQNSWSIRGASGFKTAWSIISGASGFKTAWSIISGAGDLIQYQWRFVISLNVSKFKIANWHWMPKSKIYFVLQIFCLSHPVTHTFCSRADESHFSRLAWLSWYYQCFSLEQSVFKLFVSVLPML